MHATMRPYYAIVDFSKHLPTAYNESLWLTVYSQLLSAMSTYNGQMARFLSVEDLTALMVPGHSSSFYYRYDYARMRQELAPLREELLRVVMHPRHAEKLGDLGLA